MSAFETCFEIVVGHEGGYVNHPKDPGGETKYGVTKRTYPAVDIRNLTLDGARAIYKRDFWDKVRGDDLPPPVALLAFDAAINSGVGRSVRWLQIAAGAKADGVLGPRTIEAVNRASARGADLIVDMLVIRLFFMLGTAIWGTFGKGWARRLFRLALQARGLK